MPTTIRLEPQTEKRLETLAKKTGRSKTFYLRQLIEDGIAELEEYYTAAGVLERVRMGKEKVHDAASVRKDLGLDD